MTEPATTPAATLMPAKIVYALFALAILIPGLPALIGVIIAYVSRGKDATADSHLDFQIRTFWITFLLMVLSFVAAATMIGVIIAVPCAIFAMVWALVRVITGGLLALNGQPVTSVGAGGFVAR
jgi:uncharacterized membrane protein